MSIFLNKADDLNHENIIKQIKYYTSKWNMDNISRTKAYFAFYKLHPEIKWTFLASMVSRNAGWNMCDLEGPILQNTLSPSFRKTLFLIYETANYLIFQDAFPQLLLYHYSTKINRSLFNLHNFFSISNFMKTEWEVFWREQNEERLMTSLIINEQNIIQKPVIEDAFFSEKVFNSFIFIFQDFMHFNSVLFPTTGGQLHGATVSRFKKLGSRIYLGKSLANILFSNEYPKFYHFAKNVEHTGSRADYERFFLSKTHRNTPYLRMVYPVIKHPTMPNINWEMNRKVKRNWRLPVRANTNSNLTDWYKQKQLQLKLLTSMYHYLH